MEKSVRIFDTPYELAEKFAEEVVKVTAEKEKEVCIALSGGSTPELLYSLLGSHYSNSVDWANVHFFWGDERCVPPDNPESNFSMTQRTLFTRINIPESNIHRILGENEPAGEAARYSGEIEAFTGKRDGLPVFDLIILGLGEDGHTASIFPSNSELLDSENICEVAEHPDTYQNRITLTGRVINNADKVAFLVTGRKKACIVEKILKNSLTGQNFPASRIVPVKGDLLWFLDREAAAGL